MELWTVLCLVTVLQEVNTGENSGSHCSCLNGGTCNIIRGEPSCTCLSGSSGSNCEVVSGRQPPIITVPTPNNGPMKIFYKDILNLTCEAVAVPAPQITLIRDDVKMSLGASLSKDNKTTASWNPSGDGAYQCKANNTIGMAKSDFITAVYVDYKDSQTSLNHSDGEHVCLRCLGRQVHKELDVHYSWTMNTINTNWTWMSITTTPKYYQDIQGNLHILNTNKADDGKYQCDASIKNVQNMTQVDSMITLNTISLSANSSFKETHNASHIRDWVSVPLTTTTPTSAIQNGPGEGTQGPENSSSGYTDDPMTDVTADDTATASVSTSTPTYKPVTNDTTDNSRRKRQLSTNSVLEAILISYRQNYSFGETLILECLCNGNYTVNPNRSWIAPQNSEVNSGSRLEVKNLTYSDSGNYTCNCQDGKRTLSSDSINIYVERRLVWETQPHPVTVLGGKNVTMSCSASWSHFQKTWPTTDWFINDKPLNRVQKMDYTLSETNTTLTFYNVSRNVNTANVQCNVSDKGSYLYYNSYIQVIMPMTVKAYRDPLYLDEHSNSTFLKVIVQVDPAIAHLTTITWSHQRQSSEEFYPLKDSDNKDMVSVAASDPNKSWRSILGRYKCLVENEYEQKMIYFKVLEKQGTGDEGSSTIGQTIGGLLTVVIVVVIVCLVCKARQRALRRRNEKQSTKFHLELARMNQSSRYVKFPTHTDEFPIDRLHFLDTLGAGNFGKVMKAEALDLNGSGKWELVAVKMCKDTATDATKENLYHETVIMRKIPKHINVVTYLGYVTSSDPSLLIMEYVPGGNLLQYLRKRRPEKVQVQGQKEEEDTDADSALTEETEVNDSSDKTGVVGNLLSSRDLSCFALQISKGMEHLSLINIIHRDIAARNILLGLGNVCKISDFGLARDMEGSDEYEVSSMGPLPIRWMAPESLTDGLYTLKSDVWSYGVLLWETVTLGASPYSGQSARQVMTAVKEGKRLEKPDYCSDSVYGLMSRCWRQHPGDRPRFSELSEIIERHLEEEAEYIQLSNFDVNIYDVIDMGDMDVIEEKV